MVKLPRLAVKPDERGRSCARRLLGGGDPDGGAVAISGGPPGSGQAKPGAKKLDLAHITPPPESGAIGFKWMAEELTKRSGGPQRRSSTAARS
jgi:hypothetical protein